QHTSHRLQVRHVDIEVHAVDHLVLKHHMIEQHVRHGSCYGHRRLRSSTGLRTHRASSSYNQGMSLQARPESTQTTRIHSCWNYAYTWSVGGEASLGIGLGILADKNSRYPFAPEEMERFRRHRLR